MSEKGNNSSVGSDNFVETSEDFNQSTMASNETTGTVPKNVLKPATLNNVQFTSTINSMANISTSAGSKTDTMIDARGTFSGPGIETQGQNVSIEMDTSEPVVPQGRYNINMTTGIKALSGLNENQMRHVYTGLRISLTFVRNRVVSSTFHDSDPSQDNVRISLDHLHRNWNNLNIFADAARGAGFVMPLDHDANLEDLSLMMSRLNSNLIRLTSTTQSPSRLNSNPHSIASSATGGVPLFVPPPRTEIDKLVDCMNKYFSTLQDTSGSSLNRPSTKLLDQKIRKFHGDIEHYEMFKEQFLNYLSGHRISEKTKANQLFGHLSGEAEYQCKIFVKPLTDLSFTRMWEVLDLHYGGQLRQNAMKKARLAQFGILRSLTKKDLGPFVPILNELFSYVKKDYPTMYEKEDFPFYDSCLNCITAEQHNELSTYCDTKGIFENIVSFHQWINFLYDKELRIQQTRDLMKLKFDPKSVFCTDDRSNKFSEKRYFALEAEQDATDDYGAEACYKFEQRSKTFTKPTYKPSFSFTANPQTNVFARTNPNQNSGQITSKDLPECGFCQKGKHFLYLCEKFKASDHLQCSAFVKRSGNCYHCLGVGHRVKFCRFRQGQKCGINGCNGYHHQLLHERLVGKVLFAHEDFLDPEELYDPDYNGSGEEDYYPDQ